eukprot:scaffold33528_cov40-Phaeocystis_antarctica.AAC.2
MTDPLITRPGADAQPQRPRPQVLVLACRRVCWALPGRHRAGGRTRRCVCWCRPPLAKDMPCTVAHSGSAHTRQLTSAVRGPSHAKTLGCVGRPFCASLKPKPFLPPHTTQAVTDPASGPPLWSCRTLELREPPCAAWPSASAVRRPGPVPKIGRLDGTGCPWHDQGLPPTP